MAGDAPLGPRQLDLASLTDEDFQQLCFRLIRLECPDAVPTDDPDGGADALLPKGTDGWERGWQAKRYPSTIYWSKCKASLDTAIEKYEIERMTFCFPRNLTVGQQKNFREKLVNRHAGVSVDHWGKDEILARLDGSDEGRQIARHYFGDPEHDKELIVRAIRAGGPLESASDAIERVRPVGEFLRGHDPFFTYPQIQHEEGMELPLSPGSMLSFAATEDGNTVRIDAVPRDEIAAREFAPRVHVGFTDDEDGKRAAELFQAAVARGRPVSIQEGAVVTFEQLPPAFREHVGKPIAGSIDLKPNIPPWHLEMKATTTTGDETLDLTLVASDDPPDEWDIAFEGGFGGLVVQVRLAWRGDHGEMQVNWSHVLDGSPARDQVKALRFLVALLGEGELTFRSRKGGQRIFRHPTEPGEIDERTHALLALLERVVSIEDWSAVELKIPNEISEGDARVVYLAATCIKDRRMPVKWEKASMIGSAEVLPQLMPGKGIAIEQTLSVEIFDQEIDLARAKLQLPDAEVRDLGEVEPGRHKIELLPLDGKPASLAWELEPPD